MASLPAGAAGPLLTPEQCARLRADAAALPSRDGLVYGTSGGTVDRAHYSAREAFIDLMPPFDWLRPVLQSALGQAAASYGQAPAGLLEQPRVLAYGEGGRFGWHVDEQPAPPLSFLVPRPRRCLTGSIQLSCADEYTGGELLIGTPTGRVCASREQGHVALFPVVWRHCVCPVTSGGRQSLIFWGYR